MRLQVSGFVVDTDSGFDLSLPVRFAADGARAFHLPPPISAAVQVGSFVGDVRGGGSCNCETHSFCPHGACTHTECVGHILAERVTVAELLPPPWMFAVLVRVAPRRLEDCDDDVAGNQRGDDEVVDVAALEEALGRVAIPAGVRAQALVVATAAGSVRRRQQHSGTNPPYLTLDAAAFVRTAGFEHLLLDLPSMDREDDGGLLAAHRAFFDVPPQVTKLSGPAPRSTITELIAVDEGIPEGVYALSLQVLPLPADAAPSRPLLFPLLPLTKDSP